MDYSNIDLFKVMQTKLKYHSARQAQIAQNIANADTPGYKATDVETPDFKKLVSSKRLGSAHNLPMKATHKGHIPGSTQITAFRVESRDKTYDLNPDGNNVSVEEEVMRAAENQSEYVKVLNLYRKTTEMFKRALGNQAGG